MTKMKKFLALLASLTAVATLGLATACGDKGDSSTPVDTPPASTPGDSMPDDSTPVEKTYTVTVKKPDGTPAAGYWLQTCVGDNCSTPAQTDANGVFTFTFEEDANVYHVQATNGGGDDYANYEAVDFNTVPGTLTYEVTLVEKAPVVVSNTIAEVYAGENDAEFVLTGTVLANSGKGYVLADATGSIFVYGTTDANVGDIVKVTGTRATFVNCVQLKPTAVEAAEGTAIQASAIKELTAADCDAYKAAENMVPEYASFVGTLAVTENKGKTYYNITIDGTEVVGSLVTPTDADKAILADLNGKTVKVEGYVVYVSNGKYLYSVATNISEVVLEETIATPISGTGTYDDAYVIEAGKTYVASKEVQDSVYFTLSNAEAGTYTFNLPETNEGNPTIEISGVEEVVDGVTFDVIAGIKVVIGIVNSGWNEDYTEELYYDTTFSVDFEAGEVTPDGSKLAPFTVENGQSYTVPGSTWSGVWYTFTAPSAGQYKLTLDDWNTTNAEFSFRDTAWATLYRGYATDIAKGETILFGAYNYLDAESSWTFSFGEALENDVNYDIPPVLGDEDLPLEITEAGDYEITVAAGATYYVNLAFLGQFVIPEGLTAGAWISYPMTQYAAGDTVAHTEYHPNMNAYLAVEIYNNGEEAVTATLTAVDYTPPAPILEGKIDVTTTDTYTMYNHDSYTFTAEVEGEYIFTIPAGLGIMSENAYMPEVDYYDNSMGATVKVLLAEGAEYKFWFSATEKADWEITYQVFEAEVEEGGEEGGEETLNVLTVGSNTVVLSDDNYNVGVDYTFTPDVAGLYTFASGDVMFQVLHPMGLQMGNQMMPQMSLEAGITYTVTVRGMAAGTYSLSITAPSSTSEGEETEPNGTYEAPYVIESLPNEIAVQYPGGGQSYLVVYELTVDAAGTLALTFDTTDTWVIVQSTNAQIAYLHEENSYSIELEAAGTYTIAIGTWTEFEATLNMSVSFS